MPEPDTAIAKFPLVEGKHASRSGNSFIAHSNNDASVVKNRSSMEYGPDHLGAEFTVHFHSGFEVLFEIDSPFNCNQSCRCELLNTVKARLVNRPQALNTAC